MPTLSGGSSGSTPSDVAYDATTWNANTDAATKNALRDKFETIPGYLVYTALLNQAATDPPVATVLGTTTIPGSLSWTYNGVGTYRFNSDASPFQDATKVGIFLGGGDNELTAFSWIVPATGFVQIATYDITGVEADDKLTNSTVEIRIYP